MAIDQDFILARIEYDANGCWLWTKARNKDGYGRGPDNAQMHRVAYELWIGPIPEGHQLDHAKGCPKHCINPFTLTPVSRDMNAMLVHRRKWGQLPRKQLRVARFLHNEVTRKLQETG